MFCYNILLLLLLLHTVSVASSSSTTSFSIDSNNKIRTVIDRTGKPALLPSVVDDDDNDSVSKPLPLISVIISPGVPSLLLGDEMNNDHSNNDIPPLFLWEDKILVCQGATLSTLDVDTSDSVSTITTTGSCLSVCSRVSSTIVVEGITIGDVEATNGGILNTRHARTLSYLFQQQQQQPLDRRTSTTDTDEVTPQKQRLVFVITTTSDMDVIDATKLKNDIRTLYQMENPMVGSTNKNTKITLEDVYDIQIIPASSEENGSKVSQKLSH
jgi:hypothetical protein